MFLTRKRNKRSNVNLSHVKATTLAPGNLVPISFTRILTGDYLSFDPSAFVQAFPMNAPLVNGFKVCFEYFFIPDRLYNVYANMDFSGTANDPDDVKFPVVKAVPWGTIASKAQFTVSMNSASVKDFASYIVGPGSLADYCGFPVGYLASGAESGNYAEGNLFSALKMLGYLDVISEYYAVPQVLMIPTAGYTRDYSKLFSVRLLDLQDFLRYVKVHQYPEEAVQEWAIDNGGLENPQVLGTWNWFCSRNSIFQRALPPYYLESWMATSNYTDSTVTVDLESSGDVIAFRNIASASHIQRWLDLAGAGSGRYSDYLEGQFDVSRLKKSNVPLFLGADRQYLGSKVIYQTTGAGDSSSPLGAFAGQASGGEKFRHRSYKFGENGFFMVMASLVPDVIYSRGLDPFNRERTLGDVYTPALDNLAMEPLMQETLDASPTLTSASLADDTKVLTVNIGNRYPDISTLAVGYVPAWSKLMQNVSRSHGRLATTLKYWLLTREYGDNFASFQEPDLLTKIGDALTYAEEHYDLTADEKESILAWLYSAEQTDSLVFEPYIRSNAYNDVFADVSNTAQNFVLTFSCSMRANREKGKVNVATTL